MTRNERTALGALSRREVWLALALCCAGLAPGPLRGAESPSTDESVAAPVSALTALSSAPRADAKGSPSQPVSLPQPVAVRRQLVLVQGVAGEPEFGQQFREWAAQWEQAARAAGFDITQIGHDEPTGDSPTDRDQLLKVLADQARAASEGVAGGHELWLVFLGHGTYDRRTARLNLRGPDLTAEELRDLLAPYAGRSAVVLCCSCSGAFLPALAAPNRVTVTSTKNGTEQNYSRFGGFLAQSISEASADLDKDRQVSLLEAAVLAARRTAEYYTNQGTLQTEFAMLADRGLRQGSRLQDLQQHGLALATSIGGSVDGALANTFVLQQSAESEQLSPPQRAERDALLQQIAALRAERPDPPDAKYWQQLEQLLLGLARLEQSATGEVRRSR